MDRTKRPTNLSGRAWCPFSDSRDQTPRRRRLAHAARAAAAGALILGGFLSATSPAKAWDCGDLPCADTRSWMPREAPPESATPSGCVRSYVRSHKYAQREAILNNAGWTCGMDAALARLVAEDELRSEGR